MTMGTSVPDHRAVAVRSARAYPGVSSEKRHPIAPRSRSQTFHEDGRLDLRIQGGKRRKIAADPVRAYEGNAVRLGPAVPYLRGEEAREVEVSEPVGELRRSFEALRESEATGRKLAIAMLEGEQQVVDGKIAHAAVSDIEIRPSFINGSIRVV